MKKIYHIEPVLESFVWAGDKIVEYYGYETKMKKVGQAYHVIALPDHLDNVITETGEHLSEFYQKYPELFDCHYPNFPIRMATSCGQGLMSYHLHPSDEYAWKHENCRGKVSGGVAILDKPKVSVYKRMGHTAKSMEEFKELFDKRDFEKLLQTVEIKPNQFLNTPAGVIHSGGGSETMSVVFSTNSDVTYRMYDYDRNDPKRPLHLKQAYECLNMPEIDLKPHDIINEEQPEMTIHHYYSKANEYTAKGFSVNGEGYYECEQFLFILCVKGQGCINDVLIKKGETLFIPAHFGKLILKGDMECMSISYIEE